MLKHRKSWNLKNIKKNCSRTTDQNTSKLYNRFSVFGKKYLHKNIRSLYILKNSHFDHSSTERQI